MKTAIKLWLIAVLVVIVVRLFAGCARPAADSTAVVPRQYQVVPYVPLLPLDSLSPNDGETRCDLLNHPIVLVKLSMMRDSSKAKYLLLHEGTHVRQVFAFGDCFGFVERIRNDSKFRFAIEAEAYCAVWQQENVDHASHLWSRTQILDFLQRTTGVYDSIPCKEENHALPRGTADDPRPLPQQSRPPPS